MKNWGIIHRVYILTRIVFFLGATSKPKEEKNRPTLA